MGSIPCSCAELSAAGSSKSASGLPAPAVRSMSSTAGEAPRVKARAQQRPGVFSVEAQKLELRQAVWLEPSQLAFADGEQDRDRFCLEAARGKGERLGRRTVEPLGIVDAAQHRTLLARLCQQAQQPKRDEEAVLNSVLA